MSTLEEADALVADLAALYEATRVRTDQIAISRAYWTARRIADQLRLTQATAAA